MKTNDNVQKLRERDRRLGLGDRQNEGLGAPGGRRFRVLLTGAATAAVTATSHLSRPFHCGLGSCVLHCPLLRAMRSTPTDSEEINRGYARDVRSLARLLEGRGPAWRSQPRKVWLVAAKNRVLFGNELRLLLLPGLLAMGAATAVALWIRLRFEPRCVASALHRRALRCVPSFVRQYPFHLYAVVAKSLELAYLRDQLRGLVAGRSTPKILELAVGDGTLSRLVFEGVGKVTGIDINPYFLCKAARYGHVERAIVADALDPPFRDGSQDLLVSLNLLHHVTEKEAVVAKWSRIARALVFNENTPHWARGWTAPYLLRRVGLRRLSNWYAERIERKSLQHLRGVEAVTEFVGRHCEICDRVSFLSEKTFFFASLFSCLMRCYGPPTPPVLKRILLGPLSRVALPLTVKLAELLIRFDALQDRSLDSFVIFLCSGRISPREEGTSSDLLCPQCRETLDEVNRCGRCAIRYAQDDGLLFLLAPDLNGIADDYRSVLSSRIPDEVV